MNKKKPNLSVVIPSVNGLPFIEECLESLHGQPVIEDIEIIVANRCSNEVSSFIKQKYPLVKLIEAFQHTAIPELRAMAFREAAADVIAVLEDHCVVEKDWAQKMLEAHQKNYPVIGGSVENAACDRIVDWAAFFCEYSHVMNPIPEGDVDNIPGNNASYKKWILERFQPEIDAGIWDFILHEHIKRANINLYSMPSIVVYHKMSASLGWFISQKFHFARCYAGTRFADSLWFYRTLYGAGSFFLPIVLAKRIVSCAWKKGNRRRELLLSLPILLLLFLSWGLGEATGYFFGAGSSSAKVA